MMIGRRDFAADLVDGFSEPFDAIGRARHVHRGGVGDRLARVQRFEQREFVTMLADRRGPTQ